MPTFSDFTGDPRNMSSFMEMFSQMFGDKYRKSGEDAFKKQQAQQAEETRIQKLQKRITEIQKLLANPNISPEEKMRLNEELSELNQELSRNIFGRNGNGFGRNGIGPLGAHGGPAGSGDSPYE